MLVWRFVMVCLLSGYTLVSSGFPTQSVLNTLSIMGLLISARSAFRVAPAFDYKRPHVSATRKHHDRRPSPFSTLSAISGALYRDQGKNDRGRNILVACMAILIGSCSQGTEAIKLVVEKGEIILALAAVGIVRNCCGFLFLILFLSLYEEEVWRITFFYTVVSCISKFPLDSDNGRTFYMLHVVAVYAPLLDIRCLSRILHCRFSAVRRAHTNGGCSSMTHALP